MELNISVEELRKAKIMVGTPCYGGQANGLYMKSCLDLQAACIQYGIEIRFSFLFNESLIQRARNYLADEFLRSNCTHLLFIDSDVAFNPQDVFALIALDKDIIGAPYPKKSISWKNIYAAAKKNVLSLKEGEEDKFDPGSLAGLVGEYVFNPIPGTKSFKISEPLEVMEIGTGFMLIKRKVFEEMEKEFPHLSYRPDHAGQANFDGSRYIHNFFSVEIDPDSHRLLSEDYLFCRNWRQIGGHIWYCPWMKTTHVGTYGFEGDLPKIAALTGQL